MKYILYIILQSNINEKIYKLIWLIGKTIFELLLRKILPPNSTQYSTQ